MYLENGESTCLEKGCDLVKEYKEPRTKDVWVVLCEGKGGLYTEAMRTYVNYETMNQYKNVLGIKKVTLTEGEYDE